MEFILIQARGGLSIGCIVFSLQVDGPIKVVGQGALKSTNDDMHFLVTDHISAN